MKNPDIYIANDNALDDGMQTEKLTVEQLREILTGSVFDDFVQEHRNIVAAIEKAMLNGNVRRTALAKAVNKTEGISKTACYRVLDALEGAFWTMTPGSHNSKVYLPT